MSSGTAATSRLSEVEVASALSRRVREGVFAVRERDRALAAFEADLEALHIVELLPDVTAHARALLVAHPLRAGDAIQLASCIFLREQLEDDVPMVAFDARLVGAAKALGIPVLGGWRGRVVIRNEWIVDETES